MKNGNVSFSTLSFGEVTEEFAGLQFEPEEKPCSNSDDTKQFRHVLTDPESRELLMEHKKHLQSLVAKEHKELQSMGFQRMNQSSLRSIISEKLDRSCVSLHRLEADITDATDDLTDFSEHQFDGHLVFDFDEQQRALDTSRSARRDEDGNDNSDDDSFALPLEAQPVPANSRKIPISPDISVALRGASESWRAIRNGSTTAMTCGGCKTRLHVVEDAEYVVCPDCWMVGPVEETIGGIAFELDGGCDKYGLGLGLPEKDIVRWVEEELAKTKAA